MAKYTVRISSVAYSHAEVDIEAEDEHAAEYIAWEMLNAGHIELAQYTGDIDFNVEEAEDE